MMQVTDASCQTSRVRSVLRPRGETIADSALLSRYLFFLPVKVRRIWGKSIPSLVGGGKTPARVTFPVSRLRVVVHGLGNRAADGREWRRQAAGDDGTGGHGKKYLRN